MTEEPEDEFAALFEASQKAKRIEKGQTIDGTVVGIGPEVAFVDVGGKGEAQIDVGELRDDEGALEVAVGDRIRAVVVSTDGGLVLSRKLARGAASDQQLQDAFDAGLAVEGRVEGVNKGGFEVRIGRHRAFCPMSQIDIRRASEPAEHVGRTYAFRITEYREGGRSLVVSRRRLLEEEQAGQAEELRKTVVPGAVVTGQVASIVEFGAFIDLGAGIQGLLHVSEMGWTRVPDIREVVKEGDQVTVKVLRVDDANGRIALGLKQLMDDPWASVPARYEAGRVVSACVSRHAQFGAFVELEPGVEGLAHVSTLTAAGKGAAWQKALPVGTMAAFEVVSVEPDKKRIGLALVPEGTSRAAAVSPEADDVREYAAREDAAPSDTLGSLGDRLREALKPRQR